MSCEIYSAQQVARNGFYDDAQILKAAAAAHATMSARLPKELCVGIHFTERGPEGEKASPAIRSLLNTLLADAPARGQRLSAADLNDQQIINAAAQANAEGMVSLSFTDHAGARRPTVVIDNFLRHLFTAAAANQ